MSYNYMNVSLEELRAPKTKREEVIHEYAYISEYYEITPQAEEAAKQRAEEEVERGVIVIDIF